MVADLHELIIRHGKEAAREMVPARQRSLVDIAAEILTTETNDFAATYAGFCLTSLPHRDPGVRTWERKNGRCSLLFPWHPLGRQVRIEGTAGHVDRAESEAYFATRPRGAQLSAWASAQSSRVVDRSVLERRVAELDREYAGRDVPCPPHWGGIRVAPEAIEFWQGRRDRLHDRLVYRRESPTAAWSVIRLAP